MAEDQDLTLTSFDQGRSLRMPALRVVVTLPDKRTVTASLGIHPILLGTGADCDLSLADPRVSRRHCELRLTDRGVLLRDLNSKNGTLVRGLWIIETRLSPSTPVTIGSSELVVEPAGAAAVLPLSQSTSFGEAIGHSLPMRALFAKLERAAPTDETILLLGESGTGKEVLARAVHERSRRKDGPFVIVDCGAIAPNLVEDELFGHDRGAFTGAAAARPGLLELANGGTLFIDELGELPLDLQPKLLRAIESRQVRPLGSSEFRPFNARVVAATHRNLRARAAEGSFRQDLYYRLAVVEAHVPALRERKDDIEPLIERFLALRDPPCQVSDLPPQTLSLLQSYDWPGNVRELRNVVARIILFPELISELIGSSTPLLATALHARPGHEVVSSSTSRGSEPPPAEVDQEAARLGRLLDLQLPQAREIVMEQFERSYAAVKLRQHGGNISRTAEAMGVSRQLLHRLLDRYRMRAK